MKKIAFPTSDRKTINGHFGHTKEFKIITIENNLVIQEEYATPPPHKPGVIPMFLVEHGVNTIVSGGMGEKAVRLFNSKDIEVILGINGNIQTALDTYIDGSLVSSDTTCNHDHGSHGHHH